MSLCQKNTLQIFNLSVDRTQHAVSLLFCGWQFDSEGGAESEFGAFNEDFAVMVLFDNAFGERESESPTTLFGGVAGLEDRFEFVALDATTWVGDFDYEGVLEIEEFEIDCAFFALHGVDGVFAEILDNPFEERSGDEASMFGGRVVDGVCDFFWCAIEHIFDRLGSDLAYVLFR